MTIAPTDPTDLFAPRALLAKYFGRDPRLLAAFENQARAVQEQAETLGTNVAATAQLQDASVLTLSPNDALTNEYVVSPGSGIKLAVTAGRVTIAVDNKTVVRSQQYAVNLVAPAAVTLFLPVDGELLSTTFPATVYNKTLDKPAMSNLVNAASDAAAASAGVVVGGIYHNAGALRVRLV